MSYKPMPTLKGTVGTAFTTSSCYSTKRMMLVMSVKEVKGMSSFTMRLEPMSFAFVYIPYTTASQILIGSNGFKMGGVDTGTYPTKVVNLQTKRNYSKSQFVGYTMCLSHLFSQQERSIAIRVPTPFPKPTGWRFINLLPKALIYGSAMVDSWHKKTAPFLLAVTLTLRQVGERRLSIIIPQVRKVVAI